MKQKLLFAIALLLPLIVGEVQAQKSLPSKHGFEQNGKSANARETFGQNGKSANARGVQSATTAKTPSRRSVLRAPSTDVLAPTDLTARGITPTSATVSWNGTGDSYNLRYRNRYTKTMILSEDFESCPQGELPTGWTALDADGDGHSWITLDKSSDPYDDNGNPVSFDRQSVNSDSWNEDTGVALTPDNWLISPQVPLKGKLSLWVKGVEYNYFAEHFAIYLSTTGKDVADFTTVLIPETVTQSVFTEYTADLSAYAGQVGYIAIRHFNVTDEWSLGVDNITITDDWVEADGVTSPYTLDGLDGLSIYEVQVQAVTGEQQSSWSTQRFKTLPTNATILYRQDFDDTNDINELGWTFVDNDGNGRNWTMSINGIFDKYEYSPSYTSTSVPNSLYSLSFTADGRSAINADNWAITPAIKIDESSILSFQLAYADPDYPDKVGVYVGETANVNEMTEVLAPTIFSRTAKHQFNEETVDLSAFAGKTCYIAFRHQDNEKYAVLIDDVTVYTIPPTYDLTLADGTEDATNWQGKAGEGKYQELPLEGVAAGTAVSLKYGGALKVKSVKAKKKAPANVAVTSITLNKTATEITEGQTETLSVTEVLPANATDPTYTWKTSDETKATVDQNGVVTAVAAGNVNIYAEANDGSGVQGTCAVTVKVAPTLANTLTNAGMTVKVMYNYSGDGDDVRESSCSFLSKGGGNYDFVEGSGWSGGDSRCAKALVVEDDKLVFKLNMYEDFNDMWDAYGFSVTFDTGNNTYIQWKGSDVRKNSSLISVEVNNQPINNSLTERKITVDDLDTEGCEDWEQIVEKNPDLICADDDDFIRRMTDNAKLMASEDGGNSWYEVLWNDSWEPDFTYKFEVVDETGD